TVSRHLKALTVAGWIKRRAVGTSSLVRLDTQGLGTERIGLWSLVQEQTACEPSAAQDLQRMESILAQRQLDSRAFFGQVGSRWGQVRRELFGDQFTVPTFVSMLPDTLRVADLGCGSGEAVAQLAPAVGSVIAVDHEEAMLEVAAARLAEHDNVELRLGELSALPIEDEDVDIALAMLVLHHVEDIPAALAETRRILRPTGRLVILDMTEHGRDAYRYRMGHVHLGFSQATLDGLAKDAGLNPLRYHLVAADPDAQGPGLFVATYGR
ncbi:MAG: methyltransferase domain-containing protein, partial [Myxococcota bacterium]|nr:methyltransferase domain-containing protein [Myxococcota bacterium]